MTSETENMIRMYSNIVIEAIAMDGLRELLGFKNNSLTFIVDKETDDEKKDKKYFSRLFTANSAYRTSSIEFLGHHSHAKRK